MGRDEDNTKMFRPIILFLSVEQFAALDYLRIHDVIGSFELRDELEVAFDSAIDDVPAEHLEKLMAIRDHSTSRDTFESPEGMQKLGFSFRGVDLTKVYDFFRRS